jgi:hypothetical protein
VSDRWKQLILCKASELRYRGEGKLAEKARIGFYFIAVNKSKE